MEEGILLKQANHQILQKREQLIQFTTELEHYARLQLQQDPNIPFTDFQQKLMDQTKISYYLASTQEIQKLIETLSQELKPLYSIPTLKKALESLLIAHQYPGAKNSQTLTTLSQPRILIVGAGLAGLLAAFMLAKHGIKADIIEKRTEKNARLRPQNISFKEAEECIKPLLGLDWYTEFFKHGGALDGDTGKLRITIGAYQDILTHALQHYGIRIEYGQALDQKTIEEATDYDIILIAAGAHSCRRLELTEYFQPMYLPQYQAQGRTALCIAASNEPFGYVGTKHEGYHWQRHNKSIFSGHAFRPDLERLIHVLKNDFKTQDIVAELKHLIHAPRIEYSFNFGNHTTEFLNKIQIPTLAKSRRHFIVQENSFIVNPMIALNPVSHIGERLLIAIGDANGSAHPLAAVGTLKFSRNIQHLKNLCFGHQYLQKIKKQPHEPIIQRCQHLLKQIYHHQAFRNTQEVFFANILCGLYSQPR